MADPRVLYVTGWLRSGSTLLGNVLDELSGVLHVGELHYLWRNGVIGGGTNSSCGCGSALNACPVWAPILASTDATGAAPAMEAAQQGWLRTRHTMARLAETRRGEPVPFAVRQATDRTVAVYQRLAAAGAERLVVDSSKFPAEAAVLLGRGDVDVRVLHIVRDPRATAHSYKQAKDYIDPMPPARSSAYWTAFNAASEAVGRAAGDRYLRIRHEDLCADPHGTVAAVMQFAGLAGDPPVDPAGRVHLTPNHTVPGTPDRRRSGPTTLRADQRWRPGLSASETWAATTAALPLLTRYRYPLTAAA